MGYSDRYIKELEDKRRSAAVAVGAYISLLRNARREMDGKSGLKEKIDVILPPIVKLDGVLELAKRM